jgi:hypothetical protein
MADIRKINGVTFLTSSLDGAGALEVLYASGSNEGSTIDLGSSYASLVSASLTLDTISDVKVTFYPSQAKEIDTGCALGQFSGSFGSLSPEYSMFMPIWNYQAEAQSVGHVFEDVAAGTHTFHFTAKEINGTVQCNFWANNDTNAKGFDLIWAETLNRTKVDATISKISGVAVTEMAQKPILFASGTNEGQISLTDGGPPDSIVSASITLNEESDLKVMYYPSSVTEGASGAAIYQISASHGAESPIFYGARFMRQNTADSSAIIWYLEGVAAGTHTYTLIAEEVSGQVYMNGRIASGVYPAPGGGTGVDILYIETITRT